MTDTSHEWKITQLEDHEYSILNGLGYDATDVRISGGNVRFREVDILGSNTPPGPYPVFESNAEESVTLIPKLTAQPSKFELEIAWTDPDGKRHTECYRIPPTSAKSAPWVSSSTYPGAVSSPDPKTVFVVYGRNKQASDAMFDFLRALGLNPLEWNEAVKATRSAAPYIGEVIDAGFDIAQATVVVMTPDETVTLMDEYANKPGESDTKPAAQPRPNVIFEAGMAMGRHPDRTVLVEVGELRPFSDVSGIHTIRVNSKPQWRNDLKQRLETAGCAVNDTGNAWLTAGKFPTFKKRATKSAAAPAAK